MKQHMNRDVKIWLMLVTLVAVVLLAVFWVTTLFQSLHEQRPWPPFRPIWDIELFYTMKTVVSTINATLLVFLFITYIDIYRKTQSEFTIGLIIFTMVLLLYALVSNPFVQWAFGFRGFGLGPFAMLPDLFTCAALTVLLYLTFRY
ncbi:MAG: hypothetical protein PVH12_05735 [Candidatus Bathyarchaeota archaeon]